jgi:hypothetical protein
MGMAFSTHGLGEKFVHCCGHTWKEASIMCVIWTHVMKCMSVLVFWVVTACESVGRSLAVRGNTFHIQPWRLRQSILSKRQYLPLSLHGVTSHKPNIEICVAMRTSYLTLCVQLLGMPVLARIPFYKFDVVHLYLLVCFEPRTLPIEVVTFRVTRGWLADLACCELSLRQFCLTPKATGCDVTQATAKIPRLRRWSSTFVQSKLFTAGKVKLGASPRHWSWCCVKYVSYKIATAHISILLLKQ